MAEGKFIISAQNKIKEGLDGAKKDLLGFEDAAKSVGDRVKTALTVTAIAAGLVKLGKVAFECFEEFGEGERRIKQLGIALGGNESSLAKATGLIDDMRKMSLASKDEIEGLVTELGSLGKSDADIDKITRAAVNLSNITGKDLNTSFTQINATYTGTTGKLTQLLPQLGSLTKEELAAGGAADIINTKFGEMSTALAADNIPQKLKNLSDSFGDLKENIGWATSGVFSGFTSLLSSFVDNLNQAFGKYKAFLGAKNALNFEDQAKNLLISKGYYEADTTAAGKALAARLAFLRQEAQRQVPGIQGRELNTKVDSLKLNDSSYQAAVAWADDVAGKLNGINTELAKIKAETGIDYTTTFNAGPLRTTPTPEGGGGTDEKNPLDKYTPIASGPLSAAGYSFARQFYEQFEAAAKQLDFRTMGAEEMDLSNFAALGGSGANGLDFRSFGAEEMDSANFAALVPSIAATFQDFLDSHPENLNLLGTMKGPALDFTSYAQEEVDKANFAALVPSVAGVFQDFLDSHPEALNLKGTIEINGLDFRSFGAEEADRSNFAALGPSPVYRDYGAGGAASFQSNGGGQVQAPTWLDEIGAVFGSLGTTIGPIISEFGSMFTSLSSVMQILNWGKTVVAAFFEVVGPVANELLTPIVGILNVLGSALGDILVPILEALSPVIQALAVAFVWLYNNVIIPVGNAIYSMVANIWNGIAAALNFLLGWLGVSLAYMDNRLEVLSKITLDDVQSAGESTVSDSTSAASANYATQSITVNIYQQGILIGNDGMTTLARTVRDEIDLLAYAGR